MSMTVQELIDELMTVDDKTMPVHISIEYGYGCQMYVTDIDSSHESTFLDPDTEEEIDVFVIGGDEDTRCSM